MPQSRSTPTSRYFSGQGRLAIGDRDPTTGLFSNLIYVGNVTALTLTPSVESTPHNESMTGERGEDFTFNSTRSIEFSFTAESLELNLLQAALWGTKTDDATGGAVVDEAHTASPGKSFPLNHPNVSAISIETATGSTPLVDGDDYNYDAEFGVIHILSTSTVITAADTAVLVSYTGGEYINIEAMTSLEAPERYIRFEGINTLSEEGGFSQELYLVEIPRARMNPISSFELINDAVGSAEFTGRCLQDVTAASGTSKYFRHRVIQTA